MAPLPSSIGEKRYFRLHTILRIYRKVPRAYFRQVKRADKKRKSFGKVISLNKGDAVESISKFLIGNRFPVILRILGPEI